ncbi:unnamed protein product [Staurois parvus]|uniref:Uncharacterized protein n=1 Tax=Staurois parvus TaxID=386267 RepID=A0ABN9C901_9NEOB|nr:unnamed protein product [Staurois parvus]
MLVILTVEEVNPLHCVKRLFDPDFSDPPLVQMSALIRQTEPIALLHMLSLVCIAQKVVFFLGRVHVISTGPISTVQTEVRGFASS